MSRNLVNDEHVDFFVSYTRADHQWATWIAWTLENAGFRTLIQAWDFRPGSNFVLEMQTAVQRADRVIAVLSPDYLEATYPAPEWAGAFAGDPKGVERRLVPVMIRHCEPDGLLKSIVHVSLVGLADDAAREALLGGLAVGRAKPLTKPTFPGAQIQPTSITVTDSKRPQATPPTLPQIVWQRLAAPPQIIWRNQTLAARAGRTPLLEIHLVPIPALPYSDVSAMSRIGDSLVTTGRAAGLFTQTQAVDVQGDHATHIAAFDSLSRAGSGLCVARSGQRSGWVPLPNDQLGAVLDETDATTRILGLLTVLGSIDLPLSPRMAIAMGIEPTMMLTLGDAGDVGRRATASLAPPRKEEIRWEPDDSVDIECVVAPSAAIARELAARIVAAYRQANSQH